MGGNDGRLPGAPVGNAVSIHACGAIGATRPLIISADNHFPANPTGKPLFAYPRKQKFKIMLIIRNYQALL